MTLLLLLARATALLALSFVAARLLKRRSAELRADLWRATFVALAALPVATALLPGLRWLPPLDVAPALPARTTFSGASSIDVALPRGDVAAVAAFDAPSTDPAIAARPSEDAGRGVARTSSLWIAFFAVWLAGALVGLARIARGLLRASAIAREARTVSAGPVRVAASPRIDGGFVWDLRPFAAPTIVLASTSRGDAEWERAVLAHEQHHVERRDGPFLAFASLVAALLWPTPLVWTALRRLRLESERAADDAVLRAGVLPSEYARGLVVLATGPTALPAPGMSAGHLPRRVEALLEADVPRARSSRAARLATSLVALAICLPVAALSADLQEAAAPADDGLLARAVAALVEMQDPESGAWRGDVGFKLNYDWRVTAADVPHVGVTGLAVEALLASGHRPGEGRAGRALESGLAFLIDAQDEAGFITANGTRMRSHAYAMSALAAAVEAGDRREEVQQALVRALLFTTDAQSEKTGGWRFTPRSLDTDILETAYQMDAKIAAAMWLHAADRDRWMLTLSAAYPSSRRVWRYVRSLRVVERDDPSWGAFRYQAHPAARITPNTIAAGLLVMGSDLYNDVEQWKQNMTRLRQLRHERAARLDGAEGHFLTWDAELLVERHLEKEVGHELPVVLEQAALWRTETEAWLLVNQDARGGWRCSTGPGDAYMTAIGCLLLAPND
ncbi:MAG: M56 family metallopeptidase [Planctomycetota bacterium]